MHRRVTPRAPATAKTKSIRVFYTADEDATPVIRIAALLLRVTLEAEIIVAFDEHLGIHRAVRIVTNRAAFPQRLMLEHKRFRLLAMTLRAGLIQPRHAESARGLANVAAMGIVALDAIHLSFNDGVMLRQVEFSVLFGVAIETRGRILARIENKFPAPAAELDVFAAGAVT